MLDKKTAVNLSAWLLCFLPFSLLTGSFLPDLSICIISIIFLFIAIRERLWKYFFNIFFYLFLTFYIYLLFSSYISNDNLSSFRGSLFYFRFGIFSLAVWYLLDNKENLIKRLTLFFILAYLLSFIDGYHQYIYGENIFGLPSPSNRLTLLLSENLLMGHYLVRLFPLFAALIVIQNSTNKFINILIISCIFITTDVLIFISSERTSLGLMLISTIMIIIFVKRYKMIRIITFLISIILMYLILNNNLEVKNRIVDQTIIEMNLFDKSNLDNDRIILFSAEHEGMFLNSFKMYLENPIFGVGPRLYRVKCSDKIYNSEFCSTHPHNTYLQVAAETGSIGLTFVFLLFSYIVYKFIIVIKNYLTGSKSILTDHQICLLICISLSLFPFLPTLNFFNGWINIIYYFPVGFYLHSIYNRNSLKD